MTKAKEQEIQENGLLSELSYLKIENYEGMLSNINDLEDFIEDNTQEITGIPADRKDKVISLLDTYEIVKKSEPSFTDFQGTLVQNKETGKYTVLFRGTEPSTGDILTDVGLMNNFNVQYGEAKTFVENILNDNNLNISKEDLTLTGHSLGGILVETVGSLLRIPGYAYNPLGASKLIAIKESSGDSLPNYKRYISI